MSANERFLSMSNHQVAQFLGEDVDECRKNKKMPQSVLAHSAGISVPTYRKLVSGEGTLINYITVLREVDRDIRVFSIDIELQQSSSGPCHEPEAIETEESDSEW